ncbi:MAG: tripartite tricarboxylate transporter permease [Pseudooceanicola sp.]
MLDQLLTGFGTALQGQALLFCLIGVTLGTLVGVLPGIGAMAAITMSLPITFYLEPTSALIMLAGIYYGAQYGSSVASILLNIPGTPSAAVICLDGYPLSRQGRAGVALFVSAMASFIGGTLAILLLMFFAPLLARLAQNFASPEYFTIMLLGLIGASTLSVGAPLKGVAMTVLGVALGTVGTDTTTGELRFTLGITQFYDGLNIVAVAMGLFGVGEILNNVIHGQDKSGQQNRVTFRSMIPERREIRGLGFPILRGTTVGAVMGALPGSGPTIASFMSYALEKKVARDPSRFGRGALEGIAAPEASNNSAVQAGFIPTLSLGLPGDAILAVLMGAMMIHGIVPGPSFITQHGDIFWGLIASFWIGNVLLLVLNIPMIGIWVRLLSIPYRVMYPAMLFFICIGVFAIANNAFDVWQTAIWGIIGYGMIRTGFPAAPLLLGFVLGPLMEEHLKRSLLMARGDFGVFIDRPISATFLAITAGIVLFTLIGALRRRQSTPEDAA